MIRMFPSFVKWSVCVLLSCWMVIPAQAQRKKNRSRSQTTQTANQKSYPEHLYEGIGWRNIGPFRGGRSCAVTGVPGKPLTFYFGSTGGGVWKTMDGGQTWSNISDGFFGGSIGAIAVSDYDPNVIYVGGGEKTVRGNVSFGYGVWKSEDAGKTWKQVGLEKARHVGRIRIHPKNPDVVYAAVMGDLYKSTDVRGVYKSTDGGATWNRVLFANADAGAVDLILDPDNPRHLYASTWRIRRTPYSLSSGGEGSALWKSTDSGETWTEISNNEGFAEGPLGIIGIAVSPANTQRLYAQVEAPEGGMFRSDDAGETWTKTNDSRALRQRAWYYTRVTADPVDPDGVYVMNVRYQHSTDGGKTFEAHVAPHGDHHDLWIDPANPKRMIIGDDGGAQVSFDGGKNWSTYHNQPTAQFYRVTTDNHFPYRIYAAQQDNSTIRIAHRSTGGSITESDWEATAGGESAHIAVKPDNPEIVLGGSYGGFLTRINHETEEIQAINVWPDNPMGHGVEDMKYRFQWNFPIFFSVHDPNKVYTCSNHIHVSENLGESWETISPDLTRNDSSKLGTSGGPITKDNTGVEYYATIFAAAESHHEFGVMWTGSDDGLIHVTRDTFQTWQNVTPPDMPEWMMINSIEIDPFNPGGVYVAGTRYKLGDYTPYLYHTVDYGQTWSLITEGIAEEHFTRVVRADPKKQGMLYAGTETGMYISFDDGTSWKPFQMNMPIVPITDLTIKDDNLIAATQGRSLWLIDDLTPLYQLHDSLLFVHSFLYAPKPAYRMRGGSRGNSLTAGTNHPGGVPLYIYLKNEPTDTSKISLTFQAADGSEIVTISNQDKDHKKKFKDFKKGVNLFSWNMRYPGAKKFEGMVLWWADLDGPKAVPGMYQVSLAVDGDTMTQPFEILADPRSSASAEDLQAQFDMLLGIRDKVTETHQAIIDMRKAKSQMSSFLDRAGERLDMTDVKTEAEKLQGKMDEIEQALYQTQNQSRQDPLNYPIRLNNKLAHLTSLVGMGDNAPTQQAEEFYAEITKEIDLELAKWYAIKNNDIPRFNQLVKSKNVDAIQVESIR
ncbi:VPS10 domain-containing protein [Pontibacter sp. G13]|uniref:WD40/YVTN/BNR-like repeat-containing protein n=1 Tax=Pontibacter sp. G13 TaxID=3074898 RepID=UPI00288AF256|nr:glycosyl hydrolase [Pontibacter sp. G13]WNJ16021.1 glycosyl hydrolase [Pontibacter sp. G13]